MTDPRTRLTRALLLTAASLALVALVAVAAAGYRLSRPGSSHVSPYAVDTILTIVIALYVIGAIVVIVGMFWSGLGLRRRQRTQTRRERTIRSVVLLLSVGALITIAAERFHLRVHPRSAAANPTVAGNSSQGVNPNTARPSAARQAHLRLAPFFAVLGAGGIAFAALLIAERGRRRRLPRQLNVRETLSDVLGETLDDLLAETDPRRAVIAAYARMERALAAHGVPRRRFEAPHEYLGRVLGELTGGRLAAARLTTLFERARFSPHEIDAEMKAEAIEAIESLQADLAATEAAEAA